MSSLYRYRKCDVNSIREIVNSEFYFPSPLMFNDPFDCRSSFSIDDASDDDFSAFFRLILQAGEPNSSPEEVDDKVNAVMEKQLHREPAWREHHQNVWTKSVEEQSGSLGVLCLSEVNDDILMWSHYADNHRGFCLQFDKAGIESSLSNCKPVRYRDSYPTLNEVVQCDLTEMTHLYLLSKSRHWAYEREWRILFDPERQSPKPGNRVVAYDTGLLTGIIFGCEMPSDTRRFVQNLVRHRDGIKIYEAEKSKNDYKIRVEDRTE